MRILMLTNLYPPHFLGGYELLCRDVTERLRERGHEVAVLTSTHGGAGDPVPYLVWRELGLTQPLDRPPRTHIARRVLLTRRNAEVTRYVLDEFRPDVVFAWNQNRITLGPLHVVQELGYPTVLTLNDEHMRQFAPASSPQDFRRALRRCVERYLEPRLTFERLDLRHATCISGALQENLERWGFPGDALRVIHQGVPLDRFPPRDRSGEIEAIPRLLYAGGLHPDKGVGHLIQAAGQLLQRGQQVALRIVGSGSEADEARLRSLAADCCPQGSVRFQPRVPRERLPEIYRESDVFVFPSVWAEPFGLTHLEAMASGVPVVATAVGGCKEFLRDGENALVVPPADAAALARAIERLVREPDLRRRLVSSGLSTVRGDLNLTRYVDSLEDLLRSSSQRRVA